MTPDNMTRPALTLHIDWIRCDGRGLCTELLADLDRDEWGYPQWLGYGSDVPIEPGQRAAAKDAVALCPRHALTLSAVDAA